MDQMDNIKVIKVGDIVKGNVMRVSDNEVLVDVGYAFEGSIFKDHLTLQKIASCKDFCKVGDEIEAKVTKISHGDDKNVFMLSRLDVERKMSSEQYRQEVEVEKTLEAKVKKDIEFGLLLDYHGVELFLPASLVDLQKIEQKTLVGKTVTVKVIDIREERGRTKIVVSRKQAQYEVQKAKDREDREVQRTKERAEFQAFHVGDIVKGPVAKVLDFGVVVKLGEMTDGLLHISELSHYHIKNVAEVCVLGQELEVQVIKISDKKISLSMKSMQKDPWTSFLETRHVGDTVTGTVVKKMQNGMLLEIDREVSGLLNRFDYSWNPNSNLAGTVMVGDQLVVQITAIDLEKRQFTLSRKHLEYNPWADVKFRDGEQVSGIVKALQQTGAIVEVSGVEGYLPISELADERIDKIETVLKVGDVLMLEILECFPREWKLKLSLKRVNQKVAAKEYEAIKKDNVSGNQSLSDLFSKFKK
jgi:small subunit ribosomal protein S1